MSRVCFLHLIQSHLPWVELCPPPRERESTFLTPGTCECGLLRTWGLRRRNHGKRRSHWSEASLSATTGVLTRRHRRDHYGTAGARAGVMCPEAGGRRGGWRLPAAGRRARQGPPRGSSGRGPADAAASASDTSRRQCCTRERTRLSCSKSCSPW